MRLLLVRRARQVHRAARRHDRHAQRRSRRGHDPWCSQHAAHRRLSAAGGHRCLEWVRIESGACGLKVDRRREHAGVDAMLSSRFDQLPESRGAEGRCSLPCLHNAAWCYMGLWFGAWMLELKCCLFSLRGVHFFARGVHFFARGVHFLARDDFPRQFARDIFHEWISTKLPGALGKVDSETEWKYCD